MPENEALFGLHDRLEEHYAYNRRYFTGLCADGLGALMRFVVSQLKTEFHLDVLQQPVPAFRRFYAYLLAQSVRRLCAAMQGVAYAMQPAVLLFGVDFPRLSFLNVVEGLAFVMVFVYAAGSEVVNEFYRRFPGDVFFQFELKFAPTAPKNEALLRAQRLSAEKFAQISRRYQFYLDLLFERPNQECSMLRSPAYSWQDWQNGDMLEKRGYHAQCRYNGSSLKALRRHMLDEGFACPRPRGARICELAQVNTERFGAAAAGGVVEEHFAEKDPVLKLLRICQVRGAKYAVAYFSDGVQSMYGLAAQKVTARRRIAYQFLDYVLCKWAGQGYKGKLVVAGKAPDAVIHSYFDVRDRAAVTVRNDGVAVARSLEGEAVGAWPLSDAEMATLRSQLEQ